MARLNARLDRIEKAATPATSGGGVRLLHWVGGGEEDTWTQDGVPGTIVPEEAARLVAAGALVVVVQFVEAELGA